MQVLFINLFIQQRFVVSEMIIFFIHHENISFVQMMKQNWGILEQSMMISPSDLYPYNIAYNYRFDAQLL
jgi:hypothetical protein